MKNIKNGVLEGFGEISFQNKELSTEQKVANKMVTKIKKHRFKHQRKIENDISTIQGLIDDLPAGSEIDLISKSFDSPSILLAFEKKIVRLYVATWSITPAGISALERIATNGISNEIIVMLDLTHSYKWMFQSEAYKLLEGRVKIKFLATHAKYILLEMSDGTVLCFIGSMNLSNNPRFENILITKSREDFDFYSGFIKGVGGQTV